MFYSSPLRKLSITLTSVGLGLALVNDARAEEPSESRGKWTLSSLTALRVNPIGLFETASFGYQYSLSTSDDPLFKGTYVKVAFAPSVSPAFGRWGLLAEVMPLSILRLSVLGEYVTHFGTFGTLQSFNSPNADFSDPKLLELRESTDTNIKNYSSSGTAVTLGAMLQGKVGDYAARVNYRGIYQNTNLRSGDTVYYDILLDILAPRTGWIHTTDTDLLKLDGDWTYGLRHTLVSTSYPDSAYPSGEATNTTNAPTQRLGPLVSKKLAPSEGSSVSNQSIFVLTQWWLSHRFRTGQTSSKFLPLIAAGYSFNFDVK